MKDYTFKSKFTTKIEISQAESSETHKISLVYVHGLCSDPWGSKPEAFKKFSQELGLDFLRFELIGHGSDKSSYEEADVNLWKAQVLEVIDDLAAGEVIMAGASIGGWLSLIAGEKRPERVKGIIGLAAAPDFTIDLEEKYFTPEQKKKLCEDGRLELGNNDFTYVFTSRLIASGRENQMLNRRLPINCPVHLLQGMKDASMDWRKALRIAECIEGNQVVVKLLKNSNHRLALASDRAEMRASLENIVEQIRQQNAKKAV